MGLQALNAMTPDASTFSKTEGPEILSAPPRRMLPKSVSEMTLVLITTPEAGFNASGAFNVYCPRLKICAHVAPLISALPFRVIVDIA